MEILMIVLIFIAMFIQAFINAFKKEQPKHKSLKELREDMKIGCMPLDWIVTEDDETDGN